MNQKKKIFVLIQSGYSAKNFILSGFLENADFDFTIWYDQDYISAYNIQASKLKLPNYEYNGKIDFIKKLKNTTELYFFKKLFKNNNYLAYLNISLDKPNIKIKFLNKLTRFLAIFFANKKGIQILDKPFYYFIRKTAYYKSCKIILQSAKPDVVFCTHQRASNAVAPMLAASDLGIKTACFIHSWDNIPKGVLLVKANCYLVWSDYMKQEMLLHYSFLIPSSIKITGTPQFVNYFEPRFRLNRDEFCKLIGVNPNKKYLLFTGNDKTTSPNDPTYLSHLCEAVIKLNNSLDNYEVLFRPNPIDINESFNSILKKYSNIVTIVKPDWIGENLKWNVGGPNEKDIILLINTILHSEVVINMGSTMAVDAAFLNKPTCYIKYDVTNNYHWNIDKIFKFIHFKMIEDIEPVFWINSKDCFLPIIKMALQNPNKFIDGRTKWISKVTTLPIEKTNQRLWNVLKSL